MISATHTAMATRCHGPPDAGFRERTSKGAHDARRGEGDQPGDQHTAGNAPVDRIALLAKTGADDGTGANLRSRKRETEVRGNQNGGCACSLGGESLRVRDLGQALASVRMTRQASPCTCRRR